MQTLMKKEWGYDEKVIFIINISVFPLLLLLLSLFKGEGSG